MEKRFSEKKRHLKGKLSWRPKAQWAVREKIYRQSPVKHQPENIKSSNFYLLTLIARKQKAHLIIYFLNGLFYLNSVYIF